MALVADLTYKGNITFIDNDGNKAQMGFLFPAALSNSEATAALQAVVDAVTPLTTAAVQSYSLSFGATDNAIDPALISEASDVEGKLVFQFRAGNGQIVKSEVPSPNGVLIVAGANAADPANALIQDFIASMTLGNVGANNAPVTNVGADLVQALFPIRKIHRASSKG